MRIAVLFAEHCDQLGYRKSTPACRAQSEIETDQLTGEIVLLESLRAT